MRDTLNIEIDSMKQRHFIIQDVYKKNPDIRGSGHLINNLAVPKENPEWNNIQLAAAPSPWEWGKTQIALSAFQKPLNNS